MTKNALTDVSVCHRIQSTIGCAKFLNEVENCLLFSLGDTDTFNAINSLSIFDNIKTVGCMFKAEYVRQYRGY